MRHSKKLIIGVVLAAVLLLGTIRGIALAADDGTGSQPTTMLDRVTAILVDNGVNITSEQLQEAFTQAQTEIRDETLQNRLQKLEDEGKITPDQANQYKDWLNSKPDMPITPGFRGHFGFRGMGGMRGFGGPCAPPATAE
ncbi:hypothetical protein ACFLV1_01555 [Chloroflexota bacterium]